MYGINNTFNYLMNFVNKIIVYTLPINLSIFKFKSLGSDKHFFISVKHYKYSFIFFLSLRYCKLHISSRSTCKLLLSGILLLFSKLLVIIQHHNFLFTTFLNHVNKIKASRHFFDKEKCAYHSIFYLNIAKLHAFVILIPHYDMRN